MIRTLASLLLLGAIPVGQGLHAPAALPGMEIMRVSSPSALRKTIVMPRLSASGVLLLDVESGEELMSRNPDQQRSMASTTKIMTALQILERHRPQQIVTVASLADTVGGSALGFKGGERLTIENLLKALLIRSANDVAYVLAIDDSKTVAMFVQSMNDRAKTLGMKNTNFANPAGLDDAMQYSTPRDMAWLTLAAMRKPLFRKIVATRSATIFNEAGASYDLTNTNEMLHYNASVLGVKTGTTDNAGQCLIIVFTERDRQYLLVLLKSNDRYTDAVNVLQAVHEAS